MLHCSVFKGHLPPRDDLYILALFLTFVKKLFKIVFLGKYILRICPCRVDSYCSLPLNVRDVKIFLITAKKHLLLCYFYDIHVHQLVITSYHTLPLMSTSRLTIQLRFFCTVL